MGFIWKVIKIILVLVVGLIILGMFLGEGDEKTSKKGVPPPKVLTAEEKAKAEEARAQKAKENAVRIAALLKQVKDVPASALVINESLYRQLYKLSSDSKYRDRADFYKGKIERDAELRRNPERHVKIAKFSWQMAGFGSVMEATFRIKNELPFPVKDITIKCTHSAPSGTVIDSNTRTIYKIIKGGKTRTFRKVNMGFIHSQASRSGCVIKDVVAIH